MIREKMSCTRFAATHFSKDLRSPLRSYPSNSLSYVRKKYYWRECGKLESTEFLFTCFLTSFLAGYEGWAMFVDCDFLYLGDIKELFDLTDDKYDVMCVQHDYTPKETTKMDRAVQTVYPGRIGRRWCSITAVIRRTRF
ncbi:putative nucleotide-diphospho-sugar transferase [Helianthus annuus]|nr:putative nucleotide-diphospho-sugar transferase [Helianthus annuus]KAJ0445159.1 putative nucleotide-diphospho-sugar transferase [Helianthus annuus]KAJ0462312.1 putative nucleotide-diphospho-sugar transferase [Helianthus annuus]KAJ0642717.1 putative nucleotide-diphospho-sugar transferase [Helianthus annuus]KAJ0646589.1 putative nucleotide-diphospho-sugar transferase [Helianthus annuus]